jgi:diguanylate cyclase (GGDEF)-like protein
MQQQLLLIDDSKPIHVLIRSLLADEAVDIHSAYDASYGKVLAGSILPDLVLLDVEMPGENGFDACRKLKADPVTSAVPVVFLSASGTVEDKVRGLNLGAVDYISKPVNASELLARVRACLRTSHLVRMLQTKALLDPLTGLGNRRMFDDRLRAEVSLRRRHGTPLACIAIDLDHFKSINDTYGHPFGDQVLQKVASIIAEHCRNEDVACRVGGEEFMILAPNTSGPQAAVLADRIRMSVARAPFVRQGHAVQVTCSVGAADAGEGDDDLSMPQRADDALYESKRAGRNRVSVAGPALAA